MAGNDVRVRLSPEGVREVQEALRRVGRDARAVSREAAGGISTITSALGGLRRLIPGLGLAAAGVGLAALGSKALRTADEIDELSQIAGASAENLSIVGFSARKAGVDMATIGNGLVRLTQSLAELREGTGASVDAFGRLGLSIQDFEGLDSAQAFGLIAERIAELEDGLAKTEIATDLFGRRAGARLILALNQLGTDGFAATAEEARGLGAVISTELAGAAAAANDNIDLIRQQADGLAISFISGLLPAVVETMEDFRSSTAGDGVSAMREFGEFVGRTLRVTTALFRLFGRAVATVILSVGDGIGAIGASIALALRGDFSGAADVLRSRFSAALEDVRKLARDAADDLSGVSSALFSAPRALAPAPVRGQREVEEVDTAADRSARARAAAEAKRRLDARRAALENERRVLEAGLSAQSAADQRAFAAGLIGLEEYTRRRREIIEQSASAELSALRDQLSALEITPDLDPAQRDQQSASVRAQIAVREIQLQQELDELAAGRLEQERAGARDRLQVEQQILEAEGRRAEAAQLALQLQQQALRETLTGAQASAAEIESAVERLGRATSVRISFEETVQAAQRDLDDLSRARARIEQDVALGITTQFGGQQRILELERARLPVLQALAAASIEAARSTGDPALVAQAESLALAVREIAVSVESASNSFARFRDQAEQAAVSTLSNWLSDGITQANSLKDAFRSLASSIVEDLKRIAAQAIATQLISSVSGLFGGGGGAGAGAAVAAATGGLLRGPGTGTSDSILAAVSTGEFIVRAAAVRRPGVLGMLRQINDLKLPRFAAGGLVAPPVVYSFAQGGLAEAGGATSSFRGRLEVGLADGLEPKSAPVSDDLVLEVIRRNPRRIGELIR